MRLSYIPASYLTIICISIMLFTFIFITIFTQMTHRFTICLLVLLFSSVFRSSFPSPSAATNHTSQPLKLIRFYYLKLVFYILLNLVFAISNHCLLFSMPIKLLPSFNAAIPVVPEPIVKSNTVSPSFVHIVTHLSISCNGF